MASLEIETTVNTVLEFTIRREIEEGLSFIQGLDQSVAQSIEITIICVNFFLHFGHLRLAEECLEKSGFIELIKTDSALFDERIAAIALLWAQVRKSRACDYLESFALVGKVEDIYIHPKPKDSDEKNLHAVEFDRVKRQSYLWTTEEPEQYDDIATPLSDIRVLIEVWLLEISLDQSIGGFILWEDVLSKIRTRLPPLIKFLRSRERKAMEAICMFMTDVHNILPDRSQAANFLQEYLESVKAEQYVIYKACALSRISQYQVESNPEAARLYLDQCQKLFAGQGCSSHLADIDFVRIAYFQKKSHSLANRVNQLSSLVSRYRSLRDLGMQLSAVRLLLDLATTDLWPRVEPLVNQIEGDLEAAGNLFKLLVTRIVKLRVLSQHLSGFDGSRRALEDYLFKHQKELTPDLYAATCHALYQCYFTLGDYDLAVKYAEMETTSEVANRQKHRMSDAINRFADARISQTERAINQLGRQEIEAQEGQITSLSTVALSLEDWADWDSKNGRQDGYRSKSQTLLRIYHALNNKYGQGKTYVEKYNFWMKQSEQLEMPKPEDVSLFSTAATLLELAVQKKYDEGFEFTEKMLATISEDPARTALDMSNARFIVICAMEFAYSNVKTKSLDRAKLWRAKQLKWLLEDTNVLKLELSSELLLSRVLVLCSAARDFMEFFPEYKSSTLEAIIEYFNDADRICRDWRHSLRGDKGISQLLRKRAFVSKWSVRTLYESASQFFLEVGNETNAWYWLQKKRGQALLDMLAERATAYQRLDSAFQKNEIIKELLSKDETLAKKTSNADADKYLASTEDLAEHRDKMKTVPVLKGLLDDAVYSTPESWSNLDDIWSIAEWLPKGTNIILIDFFVSPSNFVYWISKDYKRKNFTPTYMKLDIGPIFIDNWIAKYLQFPMLQDKPLERYIRAAWELRYLLSGLEKICKAGDLVILTPPARFAAIPIHAIPMEGKPWIARNTIIYSSSFSLYRECLNRCRSPSLPLPQAVFTAAYEEEGYEQERGEILEQMKNHADVFQSHSILGANLTSDALRDALTSAPWIHYHGHAYYERFEALKQCFILSPKVSPLATQEQLWSARKLEEETRARVNAGAETLEETPFGQSSASSSQIPRHEALLSAHLLKDSSQLAVADIFALDLSKNHPFVCNIACDSGLQDIAAGDEPLGLVTALFCAGASSVLGTLWPIQSSTGRSFAKHFYRNIKEQMLIVEASKSKIKVLNLALALRNASLEVKKEKGDPYSWAAFILHGAGFYIYY